MAPLELLRHRSVLLLGAIACAAALLAYVYALPPTPSPDAAARVSAGDLAPPGDVPRGLSGPYGAGLAMTPPMGWNGYNHFHREVTAATVRAMARALVTSGMKALGYAYVNLDGGWDLATRSPDGDLIPDPKKFPQGIRPLTDYVHALGLKFGIYTSAGMYNCAYTSAGSYGHYDQDAESFAAWGVDYVKLDWCFVPFHKYPGVSHAEVGSALAEQFGNAILATGRPMLLDLNDTELPASRWAPALSNMWRTAPDIRDTYRSMLRNFTCDMSLYRMAGRDHWNDPDMLEVGNGGMSLTEQRTQFSLWAEMAAPLIAGNDLTNMSHDAFAILTNSSVIAVDQDALGAQGYPVTNRGGLWVLSKPLEDGSRAIVLFNATGEPARITTTAGAVGLSGAPLYQLRDLWSGALLNSGAKIAAVVQPHAVVMYVVSPA